MLSSQPKFVTGSGSSQCSEKQQNRDTHRENRVNPERSCFEFSIHVGLYHSETKIVFYSKAFYFSLGISKGVFLVLRALALAGVQ